MFEFIGKLFGTEKALERVVDSAASGLDKLVYTEEERADAAAKERTEARGMVVEWMKATQGQNLARRLIALSITGVWLSQYVVSQAMLFIAVFVENSDFQEAAKVMREGVGEMDNAVMLILAFYFAAPHMGDIAKSVLRKKPD